MIEPKNGQAMTLQNSEAAQGFTAERVLRTRPKTYRAIVQLFADPHASVNQIAKLHRVSTHTVRAIRTREAKSIAERKQSLISIFGSVAEMSAERMEELCGKASLRDARRCRGPASTNTPAQFCSRKFAAAFTRRHRSSGIARDGVRPAQIARRKLGRCPDPRRRE